jgi:hypothetical protein
MPMPSSGAISFLDLKNEWGDTNPIAFSDYYRNGTFVDADDYGPNIPSSGAISLNNFYGAYKVDLAAVLNNYNAGTYNIELLRSASNLGGTAFAEVGIRLNSDGTAAYYYTDTYTAETNFTSFTWKTGGGVVGDYYAYMYAPTGDAFDGTSSATGSALVLSTSRSWRLSATATDPDSQFKSLSSTLEIRNSSGTALASKTLAFTASAQI